MAVALGFGEFFGSVMNSELNETSRALNEEAKCYFVGFSNQHVSFSRSLGFRAMYGVAYGVRQIKRAETSRTVSFSLRPRRWLVIRLMRWVSWVAVACSWGRTAAPEPS